MREFTKLNNPGRVGADKFTCPRWVGHIKDTEFNKILKNCKYHNGHYMAICTICPTTIKTKKKKVQIHLTHFPKLQENGHMLHLLHFLIHCFTVLEMCSHWIWVCVCASEQTRPSDCNMFKVTEIQSPGSN